MAQPIFETRSNPLITAHRTRSNSPPWGADGHVGVLLIRGLVSLASSPRSGCFSS